MPAASTGRIHDRSKLFAKNAPSSLAQRGPSIHDAGRGMKGWRPFVPFVRFVFNKAGAAAAISP
jgi:hypothetical protein